MDAVLQKRFDRNNQQEEPDSAMVETARSAAEAKPTDKADDERMSLFWRVFGGTILSIVALVAITVFNNVSSSITELRNELNREREARAELVKKEEFNSRNSSVYERIRSFDTVKAELEGLKERANANAAGLESLKKDSVATLDAAKKELASLSDATKKDSAGLELLKERFALAAADVKTVRDDLAKLHQDIEKNRAGDLERKAARDAQMKQVDELVKELQKSVQYCREKLARLEGAQTVGPPRPMTINP